MRRENEIDVPNVHTHALRAAERTNGNGKMPVSFYAPRRKTRRFEFLDLLKGETIVDAHTSEGERAVIRVPHSVLTILVTIALAMIGSGYWLVSTLTRIQANLDNIESSQREARSSQKLTTAYVTNETNRVQFMTGLLTPDRQRLVFEWDKANPRPPLPNAPEEDERNH